MHFDVCSLRDLLPLQLCCCCRVARLSLLETANRKPPAKKLINFHNPVMPVSITLIDARSVEAHNCRSDRGDTGTQIGKTENHIGFQICKPINAKIPMPPFGFDRGHLWLETLPTSLRVDITRWALQGLL